MSTDLTWASDQFQRQGRFSGQTQLLYHHWCATEMDQDWNQSTFLASLVSLGFTWQTVKYHWDESPTLTPVVTTAVSRTHQSHWTVGGLTFWTDLRSDAPPGRTLERRWGSYLHHRSWCLCWSEWTHTQPNTVRPVQPVTHPILSVFYIPPICSSLKNCHYYVLWCSFFICQPDGAKRK